MGKPSGGQPVVARRPDGTVYSSLRIPATPTREAVPVGEAYTRLHTIEQREKDRQRRLQAEELPW